MFFSLIETERDILNSKTSNYKNFEEMKIEINE